MPRCPLALALLLRATLAVVLPMAALSAQARVPDRPAGAPRKAEMDSTLDELPTAAPVFGTVPASATASTPQPGLLFYRSRREIPFGNNWGVGYELNVRFSLRERKVYHEDLDTARELLNQLAFVRYGVKGRVGSPYVRLGMLDTSRLGYGMVLSYYDNTSLGAKTSKRGLEAGMNFGRGGVEFIAGNVMRVEVVGARAYYQPLKGTVPGKLGELQVGLSGATDFSPGAGYVYETLPVSAPVRSGSVAGQRYPRPTMYGGDATLPLLRREGTTLATYVDVSALRGGGHGGVLALQWTQAVRHSRLVAKYEHREVSDGFRPGYFDGSYEQERFSLSGDPSDGLWTVGTRYRTTIVSKSGGPAAWIEARGILPNLHIWTFFVRQYRDSKSGWLHVEADNRTIVPRVSVKAWYDKWRIDGARDFLRLDDRASVQGAIAVRVVRNAHLLAVRRWTFVPQRDAAGNITRYMRVPLAEHRLTLQMPF